MLISIDMLPSSVSNELISMQNVPDQPNVASRAALLLRLTKI